MRKILSIIIAFLMVFNTSVMAIASEEGYNDWNAKLPIKALDVDQSYIDSHNDELFNGKNVVEDPNLREAINYMYKRKGDLKSLDVTAEMMKHIIELSPEKCVAHNPGEKNFQVKSLKGIEYATNLEWASLVNQPIEDLSPLKDLTKIRLLDIRNNEKVKDFDFLKKLNNLEQVDMHGVYHADLSNFVGKSKLRSLNLQSCKISDLKPLKDLKELRYLNLAFNKIDNIEALKDLTNLRFLDISNQNRFDYIAGVERPMIDSIKPLEGLAELSELAFSSHNVSDLTPLTKLTKLKKVTLTNNKIKDSEFKKLNSNIEILGKQPQEVKKTTEPESNPEDSMLKIISLNDKPESTQQIFEKSYEHKDAPKLEELKNALPKTIKAKIQSNSKEDNSLENLGFKDGELKLLILDDKNKPVVDGTEVKLTTAFQAIYPFLTAKTEKGIAVFKKLVDGTTYTLKPAAKEINEKLQFTVKEGKLKESYSLNNAGNITEKNFDYGDKIDSKYFVGRIIDPSAKRLEPYEVKEDANKSKEITENLNIEWNNSTPAYEQKEGTYVFEGTLKSDKKIGNINDFKVTAKVTIKQEQKKDESYNDWSAVMPEHSLDIDNEYIKNNEEKLFKGENVVEDANVRKTINALYHRKGDATQGVTAEMMKHLIYLSPEECTCHNTSEIKVQIKSIMGLEYATNLEWVSLVNQPIKDLSPLKDLTKIRYLDIRNNHEVKNFDFLKNLKNLEQADVHGTSLGSLANFEDKTKLRSLHANSTNISDLSPLKSLKELRYLSVAYNNIDNIEALEDLTNIRFLDISNQFRYNYVTDKETPKIDSLRPIENMVELKELSFSSHNISDLTPLTKLKKLEKITLTNNKIPQSEFKKLNPNIVVFGNDKQEINEKEQQVPQKEQDDAKYTIVQQPWGNTRVKLLLTKEYKLKDAPKYEDVIKELPSKISVLVKKEVANKKVTSNLGYKDKKLKFKILDNSNKPVVDGTVVKLKPSLIWNQELSANTKDGIAEFSGLENASTYTLKPSVSGKIINETIKVTIKDDKLKLEYNLNKEGNVTEKTFDYGKSIEEKYFVGRIINEPDKRLDMYAPSVDKPVVQEVENEIGIKWTKSTPAYEQKEGAYVFEGTLKSDKKIENISDFKVTAKITIKKDDSKKPEGTKPGEGTPTPSVPGTVTPSVPNLPNPTTPAQNNTQQQEQKQQPIKTTRTAGTNRTQTAVEISKKYYKKADTVIIASGDNYADSLSASALSKALKAPILLVQKDQLDTIVKQEIQRLGAKNVVVIGGKNSVDKTKDSLTQYNLQTIAGTDRYETSAKIAKEIIKRTATTQAIIASGEEFADALTVAPLANKQNMPILLVQPNNIPKPTQEILKQINKVTIVGGEKTISKEIANKLPNATRIAGTDRYDTAKKIYEYGFKDRKEVNITSGENFADSLVVGTIDCPILLTQTNEIPQATKDALKESKIEQANVFGGENSVSESVVKQFTK